MLTDISKKLSTTLEMPIYVDSKLKSKRISYFAEKQPLGTSLNEIARQAEAFLVYRDGFLQFSPLVQIDLKFSQKLSLQQLQTLAQYFYHNDSTLLIGTSNMHLKLTRDGFIRFREFLVSEGLTAKIIATDMVVNGFDVI